MNMSYYHCLFFIKHIRMRICSWDFRADAGIFHRCCTVFTFSFCEAVWNSSGVWNMLYERTVFFLLGPLSCGVITHGHGDVCSPPLRQLCLPIDVNGHHWFQHYLLDWLIIKETGDLAWSDQEFELVPLSIVQSLRGSTSNNFINTKRLYQYKETFRECPNLWERSAFEAWTKLDVKSIVNVSNH